MLYYRNKRNYASCSLLRFTLPAVAIFLGLICILSGIKYRKVKAEALYNTHAVTVFDYTAPAQSEGHTASAAENRENAYPCFLKPTVGVLTSAFGMRGEKRHTGIDIGGKNGCDVLASADGTVVYADWLGGYGNYIIIEHDGGYKTAYAHCGDIFVKEGDKVVQEQKIASMGSTGNSTGPHLHFEIKLNDEFLNPLDYVAY